MLQTNLLMFQPIDNVRLQYLGRLGRVPNFVAGLRPEECDHCCSFIHSTLLSDLLRNEASRDVRNISSKLFLNKFLLIHRSCEAIKIQRLKMDLSVNWVHIPEQRLLPSCCPICRITSGLFQLRISLHFRNVRISKLVEMNIDRAIL